jgi:hypothetical protein
VTPPYEPQRGLAAPTSPATQQGASASPPPSRQLPQRGEQREAQLPGRTQQERDRMYAAGTHGHTIPGADRELHYTGEVPIQGAAAKSSGPPPHPATQQEQEYVFRQPMYPMVAALGVEPVGGQASSSSAGAQAEASNWHQVKEMMPNLGPPGQLEWPQESATQQLQQSIASANRLDGMPPGGTTAPYPGGLPGQTWEAKAASMASVPALPAYPKLPETTQHAAGGQKGGKTGKTGKSGPMPGLSPTKGDSWSKGGKGAAKGSKDPWKGEAPY